MIDNNDSEPTTNADLPITHHLPVKPSFWLVNINTIVTEFHATNLLSLLTTFIQHYFLPPQQPLLPNHTDLFDAYKHLSICLPDLPSTGHINFLQHIRAVPIIPGSQQDSPATFDIVLVRTEGKERNQATKGTYLEGLWVAQVHMFFALPDHLCHDQSIPKCLAYVEWFNPLRAPDPDSGLYSVSRLLSCGLPVADVVPICDIVQAATSFRSLAPSSPLLNGLTLKSLTIGNIFLSTSTSTYLHFTSTKIFSD
ncbi:uncharacterized protein LACBIDRAFT_323116 [Laccaria bicolor S238N-H82]|uniref:Predicted protein n=1 Tax=Laccaria bicolor (strain S238N-H82 / ATCC MYA-4686) TaxID=486041 RepID=B0CZ63_LACBS|nr:uncharacterized protein LACBIDRAFT_323116 [Laccaria bicolor S238N-H82]EDR12094.1 predicted protein [Laccaria bicolor S238N-H82]|eukprot:XP_001876358.1 predicted protein [Laccaria bicolor S238N-H82]